MLLLFSLRAGRPFKPDETDSTEQKTEGSPTKAKEVEAPATGLMDRYNKLVRPRCPPPPPPHPTPPPSPFPPNSAAIELGMSLMMSCRVLLCPNAEDY